MPESTRASVAIVDYELGNLFSVKMACAAAGLDAHITSDRDAILKADAVILPGVGAFGDAMAALESRDLVSVLRDVAARETPVFGVCLGMQLLMSETQEFGRHRGLGLIEGDVVMLDGRVEGSRPLKVPHIGWNRVEPGTAPWEGTPLESVTPGTFMYFVHSYVARPADDRVVVSRTAFGAHSFCSSVQHGSVFACQFHPERSGTDGLQLYRTFAALVASNLSERSV